MNLGADLVARGVHSLLLVGNKGVHSQTRGVHSLPASFTKRNQWNKAVSEAEKLVSAQLKLVGIQEQLKLVEKLRLLSYTGWLPHLPAVCQGTS